MTNVAELPQRGVIMVEGEDRVAFLQGLVSNDVAQAVPGRAVWAAFLTPQGKWLADFFILSDGSALLLDVERAQQAMLVQRLSRYRLRSKVTLHAAEAYAVYAAWAGPPPPGAIMAPDPRLPDAGWRLLATAPLPTNAAATDYDRHRLALGLPDGSRDMETEKTVLLEAGFDELAGVSWSKGCYMGQELTARTRYRGLLKRRLVPVAIAGPVPEPGTQIMRGAMEVGTMRSGAESQGLAVLRLDVLTEAADLTCGAAVLRPRIPGWMRIGGKS